VRADASATAAPALGYLRASTADRSGAINRAGHRMATRLDISELALRPVDVLDVAVGGGAHQEFEISAQAHLNAKETAHFVEQLPRECH
jgi:hypothetical protein